MSKLHIFPVVSALLVLFSPMALSETQTGIDGVISIGPVHGGPIRLGAVDSKPLPGTEFVVANKEGTVTTFTTNDHGHFKVAVPPGHYTVSRKGGKGRLGRYGPFDVFVTAGQLTKVEWSCDSGMR
jgi:Prealbumin-like fold domain